MNKFLTYDKNQKQIGVFDSFDEAMKSRPYAIHDEDQYVYYTDGSGIGFTALRQSNENTWLRTWPLYDQKKRSIECIKRSSWNIYWHFKRLDKNAIAEVKKFHNHIRQLIKENKFKVVAK